MFFLSFKQFFFLQVFSKAVEMASDSGAGYSGGLHTHTHTHTRADLVHKCQLLGPLRLQYMYGSSNLKCDAAQRVSTCKSNTRRCQSHESRTGLMLACACAHVCVCVCVCVCVAAAALVCDNQLFHILHKLQKSTLVIPQIS